MKDIVSFKIIDKLVFENEKQTFLGWKQGNLFKGYCHLVGCGSICGPKDCESFRQQQCWPYMVSI